MEDDQYLQGVGVLGWGWGSESSYITQHISHTSQVAIGMRRPPLPLSNEPSVFMKLGVFIKDMGKMNKECYIEF